MSGSKSDLRKKAEAKFNQSEIQLETMSTSTIQKLMYEFQVHQIELELQNEELINSQQELTASRDCYAQLYSSSPIGYITLDEHGLIKNANPAAIQLLRTTKDGLINKKLAQFINQEDQDNYYFFIQEILNDKTDQILTARLNIPNINIDYLKPNGLKACGCTPQSCRFNNDFIYIECRGSYNCNDDMKICISLLDVSETVLAYDTIACLNEKMENKIFQQNMSLTKANEDLVKKIDQLNFYKQQIIEREEKINSIFNAAVEGIITMDMSGNIVSVNKSVEKIFDYSEGELIGSNVTIIIPLCQYISIASELPLSNLAGNIREFTGVRKNGTTLPLDISIAQFSISGINYFTSIVRDITARKTQEQRDQEHLDELAHVTRISLMGEMASGIAHEINQPLSAITSYSQACINLIQHENYDKTLLHEILLKSNGQALKAGKIIHRMRDFITLKKVHRSSVDINNLIKDSSGLCESYLKQNEILLQFQLEHKLPTIHIDSIQVEQVILNLIRNSIDALTNISRLTPRIISIQSSIIDGNDIEVRIKDNGPGIVKNDQDKILTPFFSTKSNGMGMGLSICRSIIEAHGGVLRFNSELNKGTTFYFTLPVRTNINGL